MKLKQEKLTQPVIMVSLSVLLSVLIYGIIHVLFQLRDPLAGFASAAVIPFAVSLPISLYINRYLKTIRKQKEELAKLDDTNKRLFHLLSHDLRGPLATQKTMIELLLSEELDSDSGKAMLKEVEQKTGRLIVFLNDILTWAEKQQKQEHLVQHYFQAASVLQPIIELYRPQAAEKDIEIELITAEGQIFAEADSYSFALRNLLQNAIKFTPRGGRIYISTEVLGSEILTRVSDSGIGMTDEQINKLKDGNQWFSSPGTEQEEGTGFGINACTDFIKQNGGRLLIDSKIGEGSEFTIVLPSQKPSA